jgi:hypothetical protein
MDAMQVCAVWIASPHLMKLPQLSVPENAGKRITSEQHSRDIEHLRFVLGAEQMIRL